MNTSTAPEKSNLVETQSAPASGQLTSGTLVFVFSTVQSLLSSKPLLHPRTPPKALLDEDAADVAEFERAIKEVARPFDLLLKELDLE